MAIEVTLSEEVATESTSLVKQQQQHREPTLLGYTVASYLQKIVPGYGKHASLKEAWAHFEYLVLPRRSLQQPYAKASPGDANSTLFSIFKTHQRDLKDFGTGVCVYFETLKWLAVISFLAGLLYIPSIHYYGSDGYTSNYLTTPLGPLKGSLLCPSPHWVPCSSCQIQDFQDSPHRIGFDKDNLAFVLKNTCADLHWKQGLNHLVVMIFVTVSIFMLGRHQEKMELQYDELALTAQDYSIQVDNPPSDATDPEEWKRFFQQFGNVAFVTVALNNEAVLEALAQRRDLLQKATYHINDNTEGTLSLQQVPSLLQQTHPKLYKHLQGVNEKCRLLLEQDYPASAIFITFQKERAQRDCLRTLQVGQVHVERNNANALKTQHLFRGSLVLDVLEAPEPSAIRWQDLDETKCKKILERLLTFFITTVAIYGNFRLVEACFYNSVGLAAIVITLLNILMPKFFIALNTLESHQAEGSYQASLYTKISIFRWVNTGLVSLLVKNFTDFLSDRPDSLIASVHAVLRAEIVIAPLVHVADIGDTIKRHLIAPFARNQVAMNRYFCGSKQNLGEKYTNATKTIFLVFFYCSIFPSGFFYGALALCLTYFADKFSLLRSWAPMPQLGDHVAMLSRTVFFPLTVVVLALMSQLFFTAYPCDNVCNTGGIVSPENHTEYIGEHTVMAVVEDVVGETDIVGAVVTIEEGDAVYRYCDQDFLDLGFLSYFFEEHSEWMSPEQIQMSHVFGVFSLGVLIGWIIVNCRDAKKVREEAHWWICRSSTHDLFFF
jgi:hypothetical protein